jgi:rubrerythrin
MSESERYLEEAFGGESQANRKYLVFAQAADKEGHPQMARLLRAAAEAATVHAKMYQELLDRLGQSGATYPYYVCPVCGYISAREAPDTCPVCGALGKVSKKID